jgi:serine/threonine protein kinase
MHIDDVMFLGQHICSAITYVHRQGYIHLDLKPSNIVAERGVGKVLDFSLARKPGRYAHGIGTRQYLAPEQARGGMLTPAADIWGIGAVLFEAVTGQPPFHSRPDGYEQLGRLAEPVRAHRRLPAAFARLVDACLAPGPAARPTMTDLQSFFGSA